MPFIYEVISDDGTIRYIGSTKTSIKLRFKRMQISFKHRKPDKIGISIYPYFEKMGMDRFNIRVLEEISASSTALKKQEQRWIDKLDCVNIRKAHATAQDIKSLSFKYREHCKILGRTRIQCSCYTNYNYSGSCKHRRTIKHLKREFDMLTME